MCGYFRSHGPLIRQSGLFSDIKCKLVYVRDHTSNFFFGFPFVLLRIPSDVCLGSLLRAIETPFKFTCACTPQRQCRMNEVGSTKPRRPSALEKKVRGMTTHRVVQGRAILTINVPCVDQSYLYYDRIPSAPWSLATINIMPMHRTISQQNTKDDIHWCLHPLHVSCRGPQFHGIICKNPSTGPMNKTSCINAS